MSLLVRKIQQAKWLQNDILHGEPVSGDAITNCLRTRNNTLSTWEIPAESQIEEAVLAIVAAQQHIDTIDVVVLQRDEIEEVATLRKSPGAPPVKDLVNSHVDIADVNYETLGEVAGAIVQKFREEKVFRWTARRIKGLLAEAVSSGRLALDDLAPGLRRKLAQGGT